MRILDTGTKAIITSLWCQHGGNKGMSGQQVMGQCHVMLPLLLEIETLWYSVFDIKN